MSYWQVNRQILGRLRVAAIAMGVLAFLYILPSLLFLLPKVQRFAAEQIGQILQEQLATPVQIGRIDVSGWLDLEIEQVLIADSLGHKMISARRLVAGAELGALISEQRVKFSAIRLFEPEIVLVQDSTTGDWNLSPLLRQLSSQDDSPSTLQVAINTIILRDAALSLTPIGCSTIEVDSIQTTLRRLSLTPNGFAGIIDHLSLSVRNTLRLEGLKGDFKSSDGRLALTNLQIQLPKSEVEIPLVRLDTRRRGFAMIDEALLQSIRLSVDDVAALYEPLHKLSGETLSLSARLVSHAQRLEVEHLESRLGSRLYASLQGVVALDSLGSVESAELHVAPLRASASLLPLAKAILPSELTPEVEAVVDALQEVGYQGAVRIQPSRGAVALDGLLSTAQGRLQTVLQLNADAQGQQRLMTRVSTPGFVLSSLLGQWLPLERLSGELSIELSRADSLSPWIAEGLVDVQQFVYRGYEYEHLQISVRNPQPSHYALSIESADREAPLSVLATFRLDGNEPKEVKLEVKTDGLRLDRLGLFGASSPSSLRLSADAELASFNLANLSGRLSIQDASLTQAGDTLRLHDIDMRLLKDKHKRRLSVGSPWLSLELDGHYQPEELPRRMLHSLYRYLPVLNHIPPARRGDMQASDATLRLRLDSLPRHLDKYLGTSLKVTEPLLLNARYDEGRDHLSVNVDARELEVAHHRLSDLSFKLEDNTLRVGANVDLWGGGVLHGARLDLSTHQDSLTLSMDLGRERSGIENGVIHLSTLLKAEKVPVRSWADLKASLSLYPSKLRIHSALWDLSPAQIEWDTSSVSVRDLRLRTQGRSLRVDGSMGSKPTDEIVAQLENINLRYILEAAGVDFTMIETDLTGVARARLDREGVVRAEAHVTSPHFHLSGYDAAGIDIGLNWNSRDMNLNLAGDITQTSGGSAQVDGHIRLETPAGIDLMFDAKRFDVGFVDAFTNGFLSRIGGKGTGKIRLFGKFDDGVTIEGEADVEQGEVGVKLLGTTYYFDDRLRFTADRMKFDRIRLRDEVGHTALLDGYIGHKWFADYDIQLRAFELDKLRVLQTKSNRDIPIYGNANASGSVSLKGNEQRLAIDMALRSEEGTELTLDFNPVQIGKEEGLMRFKALSPHMQTHRVDSLLEVGADPMAFDIKINLDVTPEAKLTMKLGYDNTNEIKGRTEGNLLINVPNSGEPMVFGRLDITEGLYTFRLEQLAHKGFNISEGGEILFRGNPMQADLDLKAVYALTANIADLDEDLAVEARRTNIPVHGILGISGAISQPKVKFAIELPGADAELERRVRSLLNTDDAVMRQMLYLVALGKFYTPEQVDRERGRTTSNWTAVASSAISEQLSYLLGNLSEVIKIGTSIKTRNAAFDDTDIELLFSGSWFDNRLLVSANVGYHDNPYLNNTYIGEFDIEYKLNRSGSLRLKGYNHYNQMYQYLRQGLTTQGVGLLFRQKFDRFGDLFVPRRVRRLLGEMIREGRVPELSQTVDSVSLHVPQENSN